MATYKNTTNPFIRSDLSTTSVSTLSNGNKPKKEAPGMAKLQGIASSAQGSCKTAKEVETTSCNIDLLLTQDEAGKQAADSKSIIQDINNSPLDEVSLSRQKTQTAVEKQMRAVSSCCSADSDVISATIKDLTDQVISTKLEESVEQRPAQNNPHRSPEKQKHRKLEKNTSLPDLFEEEEEEEEGVDGAEGKVEAELAPMEQDTRQHQHLELIRKLRLQLRDLEKYAYERGQLDEVPASVLAERQSVILDTLKNRLSLNIGAVATEKLELDELKKQVDKEIHDMIDPLITKEHLLNQLKTQLIDLERYISHLHGTIGKIHDKNSCSCHLHGCSSLTSLKNNEIYDQSEHNEYRSTSSPNNIFKGSSLMNNEAMPKTSRLIRSLVTQLICSDIKLQESARKEKDYEDLCYNNKDEDGSTKNVKAIVKVPKFNDDAAWSLHIDKVVLATDSLVNLFTLVPQTQEPSEARQIDESLVESVVRRQLIPAIRDLLSYGLIDPYAIPQSTSYTSMLLNPYYILSSLACFPSSYRSQQNNISEKGSSSSDKIHVWHVIEHYYELRNEPQFKSSSVKTLSQSFNLEPTNSGPIKITSKQALLIAVDDIIETLAKCKPNGPESHFRSFIYTALNRCKLPTWLRLVFKNKSAIRRYYHNFSFVCQPDKMDKFLTTLDLLNQFEFKLESDAESIEQYVNAF